MKNYRGSIQVIARFISACAIVVMSGCAPVELAENGSIEERAIEKVAAKNTGEFSETRLRDNMQQLSSDAFAGRAPGSRGEELTLDLLQQQFSAVGAGPGNGDSYLQEVSLLEITADEAMIVEVATPKDRHELQYGSQMMAWTRRAAERVSVIDSEVVFVGYGIVAPEYGWNDYADVDMRGKTALILVNDPGYATQDPELFRGNEMTYYGRWTYKYDEAARQGAEAAIIIHQDAPAGYPWEVVSGSWSGPQFQLGDANADAEPVKVEGWFTEQSTEKLLADADTSLESLKAAAARKGFEPIALPQSVSITVQSSFKTSTSNNVIAKIAGSERPEETVIYTAHWDHIGKREGEGDQIYNGAVDNATGTAALVELAARFAGAVPPERSVIFLAVTAEESGLLGSRYYVENPVYSLANTAAVINIDAGNVLGRTRDIVVVGYDASELDDYLLQAANKQNRVLVKEPTPEKGFYYRSDHFNFARKGVPALYAEGGVDYVGRPAGWGLEQQKDYTLNRYHKPSDEFDPSWDLSGLLEDISLYYEIGSTIANESSFPNWREGNEFRAIRDQSRASN